ncbi:hypothetical protein [Thalassobellus citreus]|uniref:hypothetical protein n=1 Tax=Thalassobellus citreus TaxID=3367752 RepID=UPI0037A66D05
MNKTLKTYLLLVAILMLNAFANLYASSIYGIKESALIQNNKELLTVHSLEEEKEIFPVFNSALPNQDHTFFAEPIEESENQEENIEEELVVPSKLLSLSNPGFAILYVQLFEDASCKVQEFRLRTKYFFSNTSLRLHAKFQVFII